MSAILFFLLDVNRRQSASLSPFSHIFASLEQSHFTHCEPSKVLPNCQFPVTIIPLIHLDLCDLQLICKLLSQIMWNLRCTLHRNTIQYNCDLEALLLWLCACSYDCIAFIKMQIHCFCNNVNVRCASLPTTSQAWLISIPLPRWLIVT